MCGIIGIAAKQEFSAADLLTRLKSLEYRGYDSFGYATPSVSRKDIGKVAVIDEDATVTMRSGIAHTRWATHGGVTRENAHPHTIGKVTLVHNGIIENYATLAQEEQFLSQTDTERLAAVINEELKTTSPLLALKAALDKAQGTWALAMLIDGEEGIFIARNKAPLLIGQLPNGTGHIASSDARGLADVTSILPLDDGDIAHLRPNGITLLGADNNEKSPAWEQNMLERAVLRGNGYAMEHEILETPAKLRELASSWNAKQVMVNGACTIIGCGSSYNAALLAKSIANRRDVDVQLASETFIAAGTVIAVSQSGETADILDAVEKAKRNGCKIIAVVNTPHSTLTRVAHETVLLGAGEERCVAATKSFTMQTALLAAMLGTNVFASAEKGATKAIALRQEVSLTAKRIFRAEHVFIIGRGKYYSLAMEFSLKLKEISYQHAEAVPALELKHGPLALITRKTPVIVLGDSDDARLSSTMHEVSARDGTVIPWCIEPANNQDAIFTAVVAAQLLTFETAKLRGTPIDMPRNLAKSVTVF